MKRGGVQEKTGCKVVRGRGRELMVAMCNIHVEKFFMAMKTGVWGGGTERFVPYYALYLFRRKMKITLGHSRCLRKVYRAVAVLS